MAELQLRAFLPGQFDLLKRALEHAIQGLSPAERTPSIKACLADKVLAIAVSGEIGHLELGKVALARMRACHADCKVCDLLGPPLDRFLAARRELSSSVGSMRKPN